MFRRIAIISQLNILRSKQCLSLVNIIASKNDIDKEGQQNEYSLGIDHNL